MKNRELEHDGNDYFQFKNGIPRRKDVKKIVIDKKKKIFDNLEIEKADAQIAWMSPNNPALWDGEI